METNSKSPKQIVFLGWSGAKSYQVALALHGWLPKCVAGLDPWISGADIGAGQGWSEQLENVLKACHCGIYCVTQENALAPWLNFEAGAVFARTPNATLFPFLFDTTQSKLSQPVSRFQAVDSTKEGVRMMVSELHAFTEIPGPNRFEEVWPDLESRFKQIRAEFGTTPGNYFPLSAGTGLDYRSIVTDARREIIMTAQNMQSLLRVKPLELFLSLMEQKPELTVDIILTVPEFFLAISQKAMDRDSVITQYGDTLRALEKFTNSLPPDLKNRFMVYFHPGACSLSSFVRDPNVDQNAVVAFVPKWATDVDPDNRIFCLVRKVDNRELFNKVTGHIGLMRNRVNSMTLEEMIIHFRKIEKGRKRHWRHWWAGR